MSGKEREMTKPDEKKYKVNQTKGKVIHVCEGYFVTSKLVNNGKTVADLTKDNRITLEKAKTIQSSTSISSTAKGSRYLILPVYENELSHPDSVKYQVRYITFK